ncbi:MAG TPA: cupin domain-containing protein, partial [Methylomirabilota bacterium]|nr:cupin domain-containing protein [Methylomirabilota bacterium]
MNRTKQIVAVAAVMCGIAAALAHAKGSGAQQPAGAKRTVLLRQDLAGFAGHEGVLVITEIPAGTKEPRHIHPGDTFVYVQEGAITLTRDGMGTT